MNEDEIERAIDLQLESGEWVCAEADKILKQYSSLKTLQDREKMWPLVKSMAGKLASTKRELCRLSGEE